jgi:hypothetical protein
VAHRRSFTWSGALLAGSLLVPPAVFAARAIPSEDPAAEKAREQEGIERDDPRARAKAMEEWRGKPSAAERWRVLEEARKERDHYGTWQPEFVQKFARVDGTVFVNVGPTRADLQHNGADYFEIDSGRARQIVSHPSNPNILYMATSGGGVWKSYDQGAGWQPISDMLGSLSIGTLAMDPGSPEVLYLGLGDPFDVQQPGIVTSRDGGATWSAPLQLTATVGSTQRIAGSVRDIKVDPRNSQIVLVATEVGLFRSTNAGNSYQQVALTGQTANDTYFGLWSIAWAGTDTWLLTGVKGDLTGANGCPAPGPACELGLWRSTTNGATWTWNGTALPNGNTEASAAGRATLSTALSTTTDVNTSRIFMVAGNKAGDATRDVYRTDDGGKTFISLGVNAKAKPTNPNPDNATLDIMHAQAWYNQAILVDPGNPDTVYVGGNLAMIRSTNGGQIWSILSDWLPVATGVARPYVHADFHAFAMGADGTFYAGTDGGIFRSTTARTGDAAAVTFSSARNEGLVTHLVFNVACAPENWPADMQGWMAGGMQDNGTRVRKGATTTFDQLLGGDGIGLAVSAGAANGVPNTFLASVQYTVYRSTDGGKNWAKFNGGLTKPLPFMVRLPSSRALPAPTGATFPAGCTGTIRWGPELATSLVSPRRLAASSGCATSPPIPGGRGSMAPCPTSTRTSPPTAGPIGTSADRPRCRAAPWAPMGSPASLSIRPI